MGVAVLARAHFDTGRLPLPPVWTQQVGLALGAPHGRLLGYRATYESVDNRFEGEAVPV